MSSFSEHLQVGALAESLGTKVAKGKICQQHLVTYARWLTFRCLFDVIVKPMLQRSAIYQLYHLSAVESEGFAGSYLFRRFIFALQRTNVAFPLDPTLRMFVYSELG